MRRIAGLVAGVALLVASGCAGRTERVADMSRGSRNDVFALAAVGTQPPGGHARLRVCATLKTHVPGAHAAADAHGTPEHVLLLNIDGQVIELAGSPHPEETEALPARDPEEGRGMRYRFETTLDVREGSRRVTAVVPTDKVVVGQEMRFVAGKTVSLVLEPVYGATPGWVKPGSAPTSHYRQGLTSLVFIVDGESR